MDLNNLESYNLAIERSVLSSFIFDPKGLIDLADKIDSDYFFLESHKDIFNCMLKLLQEDSPIHEDFLKKELSKNGKFNEKTLIEILAANPISLLDPYIEELSKLKENRSLINFTFKLQRASFGENPIEEAKLLIADFEKKISYDKRLPKPKHYSEIVEKEAEFILSEWMPIPKNTVSLITAPGGTGKSWLALQIAARFCMMDKNSSAFLWLSEDPLSLSKSRLATILTKVLDASREHLKIDLADDPTPFLLTESNRQIKIASIWIDLKKMFEKYDLIILDPLIAFFGGDENNNGHARFFMQLFTEYAGKYNKTILFIHHSTKGTTGSRGAGAFVDAVRSAYELDFPKNKDGSLDESKLHQRVLRLTKDNYNAVRFLGSNEVLRDIFPGKKIQVFKNF